MKASNIRRAVLVIVASSTLALGCELLVDFDRTKIAAESADAAAGTGDGSADAAGDTSQPDAQQDAGADTSVPADGSAGDADPDAADAADGD